MSDDYHRIHARENRIAALEAQNAEQEARLVKIEIAIAHLLPNPKPNQPTHNSNNDILDRMVTNSMPREVMQRMSDAVPDSVVRDIINDNRRR